MERTEGVERETEVGKNERLKNMRGADGEERGWNRRETEVGKNERLKIMREDRKDRGSWKRDRGREAGLWIRIHFLRIWIQLNKICKKLTHEE